MALLQWCFVFLAVSLVQAIDGPSTTTALRCMHEESKKCTIASVSASDSELVLPNLEGKTTLQIKGGLMLAFGEEFCNRLGTVKRLQLGSLQLKELCLTWELREVSAANNNIDSVKFGPSSSKYELEHLDLHRNALKTLDGFEMLVNLVEVHLEHNKLESFNWAVFEHMVKLEKLHLNGNLIKSVVADKEIELPVLEYLSLAGNQLESLEVLNWKFESLTEYDFSSNNLAKVDNLKDRFPSSQAVFFAKNQWTCSWLQDTLEEFNQLFVVIKDRDENCEGITSANICCTPESEIIVEDSADDSKLTELEQEQEDLRSRFTTAVESLINRNDNDLDVLVKRFNKLPSLTTSSFSEPSPSSNNNDQFSSLEQEVLELQSTVTSDLKQMESLRSETERAQLRLSYTLLELKKSIERGKKTTAGLQDQLDNLRTEIYRKQKQRN